VIHDTCLMDLPVVFACDRAGIVGEDGETHQGVFDVSFLRLIPNMTVFAPRDEKSFHQAMGFAHKYNHPCSLRYPRGSFIDCGDLAESIPFELGKSQLLQETNDNVLFIGYGNGVGRAYQTSLHVNQKVAILDLRFVKPLDKSMLQTVAKKYTKWFVFSDTSKSGGVASAIVEYLHEINLTHIEIVSFEYEDNFITHGKTQTVEESLALLPKQLAQKVQEHLAQ